MIKAKELGTGNIYTLNSYATNMTTGHEKTPMVVYSSSSQTLVIESSEFNKKFEVIRGDSDCAIDDNGRIV